MGGQADQIAAEVDPLVELKAMEAVHTALRSLTPEARSRVINWAISAMQLSAVAPPAGPGQHHTRSATPAVPNQSASDQSGAGNAAGNGTGAFSAFADLFSAASPATNAEKALVGGYWVQVCLGTESFVSMSVNNELKNLGEGLGNITSALDGLKDAKPQLALQVRKDGKSQQARKKYKLTVAGIRMVERMIRGEGSDG